MKNEKIPSIWATFPVIEGGKRPACKWRDESAPGYTRAGYNVGLDCGKSNLVVLDLDRHGGPDGIAAYADLKSRLGFDDSGAIVALTPSGGRHLIFTDPTGGAIRNSAGKLAPAVDVRANGGYIVLPPSATPEGAYQWQEERNGREPGLLPPELAAILTETPPRGAKATLAKGGTLATAKKGKRNDAANRAAFDLGKRVAAGELTQEEATAQVYEACEANGLAADGEAQVRATIDSGLQAGIAAAPESILERAKDSEGLERAQAIARLAAAVAGDGAAVANFYADTAAAAALCTKSAFLKSVREFKKQAEKEGRLAGKQRRQERKLTSCAYHRLFEQWGYDVRLNLCNDDTEVNGQILTDQVLADIRQHVRDYAIANDASSSVGATEDSLMTMAQKHSYHPIKDYLNGLKWDGQDHLGALLAHFEGDGYLDRWLDHWLPGAVARVFDGWQNPMLVLDGGQGAGKSFFCKWLCSPLPQMFIESPILPDYKDHRLRLMQNFVWEVQELGGTTRRQDQDALKAFITLTGIRERKAYGKRDIQKPVVCSFIGTVNPGAGFLTDLTGNRRYLVTTLKKIDWGYSTAVDVNQLWAQAVHIYRAGDGWKLSLQERGRREEQNEHYMVSDPVQVFLESRFAFTGAIDDFVSTEKILDYLLTAHNVRATRAVTMKIAGVLKSWGAASCRHSGGNEKKRVRGGNEKKRVRGYRFIKAR